MSIPLTGTGGLFTRIGRIGKYIYLADAFQAGLPAASASLFDQYSGDDRYLTPATLGAASVLPNYAVAGLSQFANLAAVTLLRMVQLDDPAAAGSVQSGVAELIRQMGVSGDSVKRCTVGITPTAIAGSVGNGVLVTTTLRGDGLPLEDLIAENARVACVTDSYTGTAAAGAEQFGFFGSTQVTPTRLDYNWPSGSGVRSAFQAVSPDRVATNGTLLSNGDFETFTTPNVPDEWTVAVGTPGTDVLQDTVNFYTGLSSLQFVGGSTLHSISQTVYLQPLTAYAFCVWVKRTAPASAGSIHIELVDGETSPAITADAQGASNTVSIDLTSSAYNSWTPVTGVFRLPKSIPVSGLSLRIRTATAISAGVSVNLDRFCLSPVNVPYAGGPGIAVFGGSIPFAAGDGWTLALTNDQGGSTYGATWQTLFDRLFGMKEMGLLLPSSASPTIADTLITS